MKKFVTVEVHPLLIVKVAVDKEIKIKNGEKIIFLFKDATDIGTVKYISKDVIHEGIFIRKPSKEDFAIVKENKLFEKKAMKRLTGLIKQNKLPMKTIDAHYWLDRKKIVFYFYSKQRVDFRKIHKIISDQLECGVIIKQIGVRDIAKIYGGYGKCGRELCCVSFLKELYPITLREARVQNLYINPDKISGLCGRLLCCLRYELESYRDKKESKIKLPEHFNIDEKEVKIISVNNDSIEQELIKEENPHRD